MTGKLKDLSKMSLKDGKSKFNRACLKAVNREK